MSIQTRTTAIQDELVRLYCYFIQDGMLANPGSQPVVEILDTDGVTVLDAANAQIENTGVWYADWYVPANLPLGEYYDRWTFQWGSTTSVTEMVMVFSVHSLDSYVNFLGKGVTVSTSSRANQLLMDLSNDFIFEAQHIPQYFEMGMRMQQENQAKRSKSYYYFTLDSTSYSATEGAVYTNNGQNFTVFQSLTPTIYSSSSSDSSSSSSSVDSSSSSSIESFSSHSSSSSSSVDSNSSQSSSSTSSSSIDSSSSTSEEIVTTTTTTYAPRATMTCVGTGDPTAGGTLVLFKGEGDPAISFTSFEKKVSKFSTIYNFAYPNWNMDPAPIVRLNKRIVQDGWHLDYNGKIYFDRLMAPEDSVNVAYNFAYFSKEELLSFLNFGLKMMNSIPPASDAYSSLEQSPSLWDPGILLVAAITALKRLIFGWTYQEKRIIYYDPRNPEAATQILQNWKDLYQSYQETWVEFGKNVKTRKLPGIAMYVTPEYTLPGGRSRWFRYLYKQNA